jgi:hypothetical protein
MEADFAEPFSPQAGIETSDGMLIDGAAETTGGRRRRGIRRTAVAPADNQQPEHIPRRTEARFGFARAVRLKIVIERGKRILAKLEKRQNQGCDEGTPSLTPSRADAPTRPFGFVRADWLRASLSPGGNPDADVL